MTVGLSVFLQFLQNKKGGGQCTPPPLSSRSAFRGCTPGPTPPPLRAPSPVQGRVPVPVPVPGSAVQLTAVLQPGQRVHALHHQLQQVAHLAEGTAGLQPARHCRQRVVSQRRPPGLWAGVAQTPAPLLPPQEEQRSGKGACRARHLQGWSLPAVWHWENL